MDLVWEMEEATVRDVYEVLLRRRGIAYTTVMTIMGNLAKKGLLHRRTDNRAYVYSPALSKDAFARAGVSKMVDDMVSRFAAPVVTYLVDHMAEVDPDRLAELEEAISRLRKKGKEPGGV